MKNKNHPKYIQIETSNICNGTCGFCPQSVVNTKAFYMDDMVWRKIIDDTRGLGVVYRPFMLNEPFADPRMEEILDYICEDETAKVEFNSNASLISSKMARMLSKKRISVMRFSIDGISDEIVYRARGILKSKVYNGALRYIEENRKSKNPSRVEVRMISHPENKKEEEKYLQFWKKKVDEIVFTKLYQYPWTNQRKSILASCPKILNEMFIRWDGSVVLCCWDAWGKAVVGSILEGDVLGIWGGDKMNEYRNYLKKGQRYQIELCSRCDAFKERI